MCIKFNNIFAINIVSGKFILYLIQTYIYSILYIDNIYNIATYSVYLHVLNVVWNRLKLRF